MVAIRLNCRGKNKPSKIIICFMARIQKGYFDLFAIFLLALGAAWIAASRLPASAQELTQAVPVAGFLAPDFTLNSLTGETFTLSKLRGRPVLINLWASWCGPCRAEMPAIQRVYDQYRDQGFVVLAVNATRQDSLQAAQAFVDEFGFTYPILLDVDGVVASLYQLRAFPSSYFVDADGIIQEVVLGGPMNEALLATRVEQLLGGQD